MWPQEQPVRKNQLEQILDLEQSPGGPRAEGRTGPSEAESLTLKVWERAHIGLHGGNCHPKTTVIYQLVQKYFSILRIDKACTVQTS